MGLLAVMAAETAHAAAEPRPRGEASTRQADQLVERARAHFEAGNAHYAAGRFQEAIRQFQAGYALVPRPNFLVNLGQAYRKLGELQRAKESYLAYVRALPASSALRDQALQVLAEIEVQLQERGAALPASPAPGALAAAPAPAPAARPTTAAATSTSVPGRAGDLAAPGTDTAAIASPGSAGPALDARGAAEDKGNRRATRFALILGGAGVALAGTGLAFQLRAHDASRRLSRLDRTGQTFDPGLEQRGRRDQRLGIGLLSAGGAALAAAVTVYLWLGGESSGAEPGSVAATVGPQGWLVGARF